MRSLWFGLKEKAFRALFLFVLLLITSGTIFYIQVEKLSFVDSLYFCVTTFTTIGGKLQSETMAGKIFTIIYILLSLGSIAAFIAAIAHHTEEQYPDLDKISERFFKKN